MSYYGHFSMQKICKLFKKFINNLNNSTKIFHYFFHLYNEDNYHHLILYIYNYKIYYQKNLKLKKNQNQKYKH